MEATFVLIYSQEFPAVTDKEDSVDHTWVFMIAARKSESPILGGQGCS